MRRLPLISLGLLLIGRVAGEPAALPPLQGQVQGELRLLGDALAPVPWRLALAPGPEGRQRMVVEAELPGGLVRAVAIRAPGGQVGEWRVEQGALDVPALATAVAAALAPALGAYTLSGQLVVSGAGEWRDDQPRGPIRLEWSAPVVSGTDPALAAQDVRVQLELDEGWAKGELSGRGELQVAMVTVAGIALSGVRSPLQVHPDYSVTVGPTRLDALGGAVALAPFTWQAEAAELRMGVQVTGVDLEALAKFAPQAVREAQGRVDGRFVLAWDAERGVLPVDGSLEVPEGEAVQVRLAPRPGFLTRQVPPRLSLLPGWAGAVGRRFFSPPNPAFQTLQDIETGKQPLVVNALSIEFFPPDDPLGRTAQVRLEGRPSTGAVVESVTIEVNLSGPVADVLRLGMDDRVNIQADTSGEPPPQK